MCTIMEYSKGAVVPPHKHHHEQVGYVVSGKYRATVGGKDEILGPGDSYAFPGNTEHAFEALEAGQIIDVFTPIRKEYMDPQ
ncbi:MAG: cupin domain-containing protein [Candidatus Peribacteraceae bacterium]|nr:cupin domain-containing protein [Candidatus Peribacteraceae bacterium]